MRGGGIWGLQRSWERGGNFGDGKVLFGLVPRKVGGCAKKFRGFE